MTKYKWAPKNRDRWPAGCTPSRDGWVRWYRGKTRFVAGRKTPIGEVEDKWIKIKTAIDSGAALDEDADSENDIGFREAAIRFLNAMLAKVGAVNRGIEHRTYQNYVAEINRLGKFEIDGVKVGDMDLKDVARPPELSAFANSMRHWKASGFDSTVSRLSAFFDWCVEMNYLMEWKSGPDFKRPAKQQIRDQRIGRVRALTAEQIAKAYEAANHTLKCWIALGVCGAMINSDIAHLTRSVIDLETGIIDMRRRKTGKIRRVIPLPADVVDLLKQYSRPDPAEEKYADLFFLTRSGLPFSRTLASGPACAISSMFGKLLDDAGIRQCADGRNFAGIRTSFYNLSRRFAEYDVERRIVMGRAQGTIDFDHYLEDVGIAKLKSLVDHIWREITVHFSVQPVPTAYCPDLGGSECSASD